MTDFLLCVLQYLLIMIILAVVGFCGGKVGVALRKKKDSKIDEQILEDISNEEELWR